MPNPTTVSEVACKAAYLLTVHLWWLAGEAKSTKAQSETAAFLLHAREMFDEADSDGSYDISAAELQQLMSQLIKGKMGEKEMAQEVRAIPRRGCPAGGVLMVIRAGV